MQICAVSKQSCWVHPCARRLFIPVGQTDILIPNMIYTVHSTSNNVSESEEQAKGVPTGVALVCPHREPNNHTLQLRTHIKSQ